jgi:MFS family permease
MSQTVYPEAPETSGTGRQEPPAMPPRDPGLAPPRGPTGMRGFTIVWLGQLVSLLGTGMTQFAITIWAWELTGEATALALVGFFTFAPSVLLSPFAGTLVDRWNRKAVMMASDLAAGAATGILLLLTAADRLEIWHLYVAGAFAGAFNAFQFPAYSAGISLMVRKEDYARAAGMLSMAEAASHIAAPVMAGILLSVTTLGAVLVIDLLTFVFAIGTLALVFIPEPDRQTAAPESKGSFLHETAYGFRYIFARPSLLGLQVVFLLFNLIATFSAVVVAPMILARTGNNAAALGTVQAALGAGSLSGAVGLSVQGGPRRKVRGVLAGLALSGLLGEAVLGLGKAVPVWMVGGFMAGFFIPIVNGSNQAIWQAKVPPGIQGRVFSVRRLIAAIAAPVAMLMAGPAADNVFEPLFMTEATAPPVAASLVGTGPGAGMAFMLLISGIAGALVAFGGYLVRPIRDVETILPDHEEAPANG